MEYDHHLYTGRPAEARSETEDRCYDFLDRLGISYARVDHEHADTIEACELVEDLLGCRICKNLFLCNRQQTDFYLLLMPGQKPFKTKILSKQIGSARLSFADADHMRDILGLTPGSVSVLGLMNDREKRVRLLMDRELLRDEYFGCHPCLNTSSLRIAMEDLTGKILPELGYEPLLVDLPWNPDEERGCKKTAQ